MPVKADILNLFLGVNPAGVNAPSGTTTLGAGSANGTLFADILGMIGNPTLSVVDNTATNPSTSKETTGDTPSESITNKLSGPMSPVWMLGRPDEFTGAGQPSTNFVTGVSNATVATSDITSGQPVTRDNHPADEPTLTPFVVAAQQSLLSVAQPTALTDGTFTVLDSNLHDSTVELTLQSNKTGESIRVSLPLEQLMQSGTDGRLNLTNQSEKMAELANWFEKLSVREVKVETLTPNSLNDTPVKLTLTSGLNAANSGIEISLPKSEIKAFRISNLGHRLNKSDMTGGGSGSPIEFGVPSVTPVAKPINVVPRMMSADDSALSRGMFEELAQSADGQVTGTDSRTLTPTFAQEIKVATTPSDNRVEFGSVRFTLPDKIDQSLLPGGKSVILKIHPEHLGPARLNLNWGGDGLSARVTVDSPLAQTAIERSLDKLQEQLSQAGIKVDHIGVSLSGGHTRGQFAHSQPQWQRQSNSNHLYFNGDYRAAEYVSAVASVPTGMAQYVGSQGVNLFA